MPGRPGPIVGAACGYPGAPSHLLERKAGFPVPRRAPFDLPVRPCRDGNQETGFAGVSPTDPALPGGSRRPRRRGIAGEPGSDSPRQVMCTPDAPRRRSPSCPRAHVGRRSPAIPRGSFMPTPFKGLSVQRARTHSHLRISAKSPHPSPHSRVLLPRHAEAGWPLRGGLG